MTFKTRKLIQGAAAMVLLTTSAAWAQTSAGLTAAADKTLAAKDMMAAFAKADANKDGKLDVVDAENVPGLVARFKRIDADGDGMVSRAEFEKANAQ